MLKYNVFNSRINNPHNFQNRKYGISEIKYIEETVRENDLNKKEKF